MSKPGLSRRRESAALTRPILLLTVMAFGIVALFAVQFIPDGPLDCVSPLMETHYDCTPIEASIAGSLVLGLIGIVAILAHRRSSGITVAPFVLMLILMLATVALAMLLLKGSDIINGALKVMYN